MIDGELESEHVTELPRRLETTTFFSPVVIVNTSLALSINGVNFGGSQTAAALAAAGTGVSLS